MEINQKELRRSFIADTIKWYSNKYPQKFNAWMKHTREVKNSRANIFGSDKELDMRFLTSIPTDLYDIFDGTLDSPKFLEDKNELSWFAKNFKHLVTFEKY
jgi:hypothetical protein